MKRHFSTPVIVATVIGLSIMLGGCVSHTEPERQSTVSRTEDRAEVVRIFHAAIATFDPDGWEVSAGWLDCSDVAPESVQYSFFASRQAALPSTPEATIRDVARRLTELGYPVSAQHETTGDLWAVGYPHGFLGGRAADGAGFEVTAREDYAAINIDGHCVPGDIPTDPDDPLNATPSPFPKDGP
jgi:hypothetical protein